MGQLSQLYVYPVKSMRGLQLSHAQVLESGLAFDRLFMLTRPDGQFITARQHTKLLCYTPVLTLEGMLISAPDGSHITLDLSQFSACDFPTQVWGNHFTSRQAPEHINAWFSEKIGEPVTLRWTGQTPTRRIKRFPDNALSFADGYPFMLFSQASFEMLQSRCPTTLMLPQMRPNFVVSGVAPFAEDSWQTIRIGDIIFDVIKPCSRCNITTMNIETGVPHPTQEPLTTLSTFRTTEKGDVDFGQMLIARNQGVVRIHDDVEVLATKPPMTYPLHERQSEVTAPSTDAPIDEKAVVIDYNGVSFIGNNRQPLLEQIEQQGMQINYSCRAGICGCCRVNLIGGEVVDIRKKEEKSNESILACSCRPKGNVIIRSKN